MNEEGYVVASRHKFASIICKYSELGAFIGFIAGYAFIYFRNDYGSNFIYKLLSSFMFEYILLGIGAICLITTIALRILFLKEPKVDEWIWEIAVKRLSSRYSLYDSKLHYIDYDVSINAKEIREFILEINEKSERFTYYLGKVEIDKATFELRTIKKEPVPNKAVLNIETDDKNWNNIPLGLAVNTDLQKISQIAWKLNDNIKDEELINTLPSVSLLITGGTGSGKSVFENAIIGHISRFPDRFQAIACDVKIVEFIRLEGLKGIKRIALTVKECDEAIAQTQKLMMKRFDMMKDHKANNIYDIEGIECNYYELNGVEYQFDEIFPCKIDGKFQLVQIEDIYKLLDEGKEVEVLGQAEVI